jgi:hypothetical protein
MAPMRPSSGHRSRLPSLAASVVVVALGSLSGVVRADPPDYVLQNQQQINNSCLFAACGNNPSSGGQAASHTVPGVDPCFIAQNAMRPCTQSKLVGVDPNLVGKWLLPRPGGNWVLEVFRTGSYEFHSEAKDGVASHAGAFAAGKGQWSMKATNGYIDGGPYLFQPPDTWIAAGRLGSAAWRPSAPAECPASNTQSKNAGGIDSNLVGKWLLPRQGGNWVLEVFHPGTYEFHSEAKDGVAPHAGAFAAGNGQWSMNATNGYMDGGPYVFQPPDIWIAEGHLGTAAWRQSTPVQCPQGKK